MANFYIRTLAIVISCLAILSCSKSKPIAVEAPPGYQAASSDAQVNLPTLGSAKLPEVEEAVKRVFKDSAVIDANANPNFFVGDFNGDLSQDLAVVIKPAAGKLPAMNEEYPSWLLRDPTIDSDKRPSLKVADQETLLAIIHGYGNNNWRDPQATQTFLLKNAVGSNMSIVTGKDFATSNKGHKSPPAEGDLIGETLHGTNGYLYFATSSYAWYDPKTYKPKPINTGMFHSK
ncbi:MAG TPA: hypothetical protein VI306_15615 [Pyrinomonadaceae bacterium]